MRAEKPVKSRLFGTKKFFKKILKKVLTLLGVYYILRFVLRQ